MNDALITNPEARQEILKADKEALKELSDPVYLEKLLKSKKEFEQGKGIPAATVYKRAKL